MTDDQSLKIQNLEQVKQFLGWWFAHVPKGTYLEKRTKYPPFDPNATIRQEYFDSVDSTLEYLATLQNFKGHVWFSLQPRSKKLGTTEAVARLCFIGIDFDSLVKNDKSGTPTEKHNAMLDWANGSLKNWLEDEGHDACVISSGNGIQLFFAHKNTKPNTETERKLHSENTMKLGKKILEEFAPFDGAFVDEVKDAARVLRSVGFPNPKGGRLAELLYITKKTENSQELNLNEGIPKNTTLDVLLSTKITKLRYRTFIRIVGLMASLRFPKEQARETLVKYNTENVNPIAPDYYIDNAFSSYETWLKTNNPIQNEVVAPVPLKVSLDEDSYCEMLPKLKKGWILLFDIEGMRHAEEVSKDTFYMDAKLMHGLTKRLYPKTKSKELITKTANLMKIFTMARSIPTWDEKISEVRNQTFEQVSQAPPPTYTCYADVDTLILQQIYDPENGSRFVSYDGKEFTYVQEHVSAKGVTFLPLDGEEIARKFVNLASEIIEYNSLEKLVQEIIEWSKRYSDVPDWFREFAAYYVVFTWVYDVGNAVPYLRFLGDTGCGKSRGLDVFGSICYNSVQMNGAATIAPVYRIMDKWHGTLLVEESDLKGSDETNEFIKIINCGIERNRPILRCDIDDPNKVRFYDPFCPKVFAARHQFKDMATESRCLSTTLKETKRKDIAPLLPTEFYKEGKELRNKLLCFRLKNIKTLNPSPANYLPIDLEPRLKQMGMPLLILFNGSEDPAYKRFAEFLVNYQKQLREARANSFAGLIVNTLIDLIETNEENEAENQDITCKKIADALNVTVSDVSREIRAFDFKTEGRHIYVQDSKGNQRRKTIRAIVCSENAWETTCQRYGLEGLTLERPDYFVPKTEKNDIDTPSPSHSSVPPVPPVPPTVPAPPNTLFDFEKTPQNGVPPVPEAFQSQSGTPGAHGAPTGGEGGSVSVKFLKIQQEWVGFDGQIYPPAIAGEIRHLPLAEAQSLVKLGIVELMPHD